MVRVYVLELTDGCYYVGVTKCLERRWREHLAGTGAVWTKLHPPLRIVESLEGDELDEDKYTLKYMQEYGIDKVRGGSFTQPTLPAASLTVLEKMLRGARAECFRCGQSGHFSKDCSALFCERCGRTNHREEDCYAKTHRDGSKLPAPTKCTRCGRANHVVEDCYAKTSITGATLASGSLCQIC